MNEGLSLLPASENSSESTKTTSESKTKKGAKEAKDIGSVIVKLNPEGKASKAPDQSKPEHDWHRSPRIEAKAAVSSDPVSEKIDKPEQPLAKTEASERQLIVETNIPPATVEQITKDETQVVEKTVAEAMQQATPERSRDADTDPAEAFPDQASKQLLDKITKEGKDSTTAFTETLQAMDVESDRIAELVQETSGPPSPETAETEAAISAKSDEESEPETGADLAVDPEEVDESTEEDPENPDTEPLEPPEHTAETPPDDDEVDPDDTAAKGGTGGGSTTTTGGGGGAGSGGGTPPVPPHGPGGGPPGGGPPWHGPVPPFGSPGGPGGHPNFNAFNPTTTVLVAGSVTTAERNPAYDGGNAAGAALLGGIVGYLIGRRRGRIKTEARLLPVQKKLEKQVTNLQWQLQEKESTIRRVAADQVRTKGVLMTERFNRTVAQQTKRTGQEATSKARQERIVTGRRPAPEAHHLHGSQQQAPEHIGHMLIAAEALPLKRAQKSAPEMVTSRATMEKNNEVSVKPLTEKRIETLSRAELLELSERIVIDGTSLRQIYENNLIGERGLRRLLTEYMHGGDIKRALKHEILEREIDFERDPVMRDLARQGGGTATGGGKATLNNLIEKAAANVVGGQNETAVFKEQSDYQATQEQHEKQRRIIDVTMTVVIVGLIAAVVILYITRS